jgi:hypothetical protein
MEKPALRRNSMTKQETLTMSVPGAGLKYFELSRGASYEAAKRGDIPTIKVGRLLRVPVRALEAMLDNAGQKSTEKKRTVVAQLPAVASKAQPKEVRERVRRLNPSQRSR